MNKIDFSPLEEKLYALASSTREIERCKRSSLVTSLLFSLLFLGVVYSLEKGRAQVVYSPLFAGILTAYALVSGFAVLNFRKSLAAYRSILRKIAGRLAVRTEDPHYREMAEAPDRIPEQGLKQVQILLMAFFIGVLWALCVLPCGFRMWAAAGAVVFFLLLSARIKCLYADLIIAYKKQCLELGTLLREKTWPDSK